MLTPRRSGAFKQEYALAERRGRDMSKLDKVMEMLVKEQPLPPDRLDHPLHGSYSKYRECHIQGDWVLIYRIYPAERQIVFDRTGTHSDLFKK
ncbi:MAG: type II toxin-antitoxin system YafQ family toxin [Spirochaetaceae bacterium]|nr:type II toxin-antitoxin system YafQ family toxin [Spirochaetaceae bacterium]